MIGVRGLAKHRMYIEATAGNCRRGGAQSRNVRVWSMLVKSYARDHCWWIKFLTISSLLDMRYRREWTWQTGYRFFQPRTGWLSQSGRSEASVTKGVEQSRIIGTRLRPVWRIFRPGPTRGQYCCSPATLAFSTPSKRWCVLQLY